jgi:hypothetical protein
MLKEELEPNIMANSLLPAFVVNNLYMFELGFREKQRIYDLLGISIKDQRTIEMLTPKK